MPFLLDESIGFVVNQTALKLRTEMSRRLKPFGLTPEQWSVLNRLAEQDGISQRELADRTFKDQPTIARILDKLMALELVRRDDSTSDRRAFTIIITDRGRELRQRILPVAEAMNDDAGRELSDDERRQLFRMLKQLQKNMGSK
ncbi:MarR family transcriptional regulator [Geotalea sp. SG265]|uniref:MarR family winged helix-turn-helix transcriptional regulator n=1 Tax=Geotalea sp. SG265 TaxID=2922867 RepID=UPI001FAF2861|nr:MarR family transcriptional regulator [Geotalea sp. SG265]